jgi:hypothetical protein
MSALADLNSHLRRVECRAGGYIRGLRLWYESKRGEQQCKVINFAVSLSRYLALVIAAPPPIGNSSFGEIESNHSLHREAIGCQRKSDDALAHQSVVYQTRLIRIGALESGASRRTLYL